MEGLLAVMTILMKKDMEVIHMEKMIDLNKNVAELCKMYPELKEIMAEMGFKDILKPLALKSMGRFMTIPKGAAIKEIPIEKIVKTLNSNGFQVVHVPKSVDTQHKVQEGQISTKENEKLNDKEKLLKNYIERLTKGESLEIIQEEFKMNFSGVSAVEIARAEQTLLKEGTPLSDVQKLCDVHSALFHGATQAERIAKAEKEVEKSKNEEEINQIADGFDTGIAVHTANLMNESGHPLHVLSLENEAIEELLNSIDQLLADGKTISETLDQLHILRTIARHYGKKDELMFPLLKDKYGYPGPSDVMWGVEDEIRERLRQIIENEDNAKEENLTAVLKRIREMIYKENNILFPLCVSYFSEEEWLAIAEDIPMFGACMIAEIPKWSKLKRKDSKLFTGTDKVSIPGGTMTLPQLRAMLNTLPMEITLIDENEINCFFNEGDKLFTRPTMALGRKVYSCHPKRVEPMVRMLIHEFKTGKKDSMHIMSEKCGKSVLINYYALRDENGAYLGTMEAVQQLNEIKDAIITGKKGPI